VLVDHIIYALQERSAGEPIYSADAVDPSDAAGVLLLLSNQFCASRGVGRPCLILNKRSQKVRQPGDLCCPGGSVAPLFDSFFAKFLSLPFVSLDRWKYWRQWKKHRSPMARKLALFWATGLRECFEEMRLNPFGVRFLGPLPPHALVMFQRTIFPLVAWIDRQKRFIPNWEVEKVVTIPLEDLLNPANYARYRLRLPTGGNSASINTERQYPCFQFQSTNDTELVWGATYRIITVFLSYIFDFNPPEHSDIPIIDGTLKSNYLTGNK
jgi:hypothetical protein